MEQKMNMLEIIDTMNSNKSTLPFFVYNEPRVKNNLSTLENYEQKNILSNNKSKFGTYKAKLIYAKDYSTLRIITMFYDCRIIGQMYISFDHQTIIVAHKRIMPHSKLIADFMHSWGVIWPHRYMMQFLRKDKYPVKLTTEFILQKINNKSKIRIPETMNILFTDFNGEYYLSKHGLTENK